MTESELSKVIEWVKSVSRYDTDTVYYTLLALKGQLLVEYPHGFMEVWPVTYEQLGRLVCKQFNYWEANGGPVSYVAEVYADNTRTFRNLVKKGFEIFRPQYVAWHKKGKDFVVFRSVKWVNRKPHKPQNMSP